MSNEQRHTGSADKEAGIPFGGTPHGAAGLLAWLAGSPPAGRAGTGGWWATRKRQWLKTFMTTLLLLAGLGAWALAVVQPWVVRPGDPGIVALPAVTVNPEKVRSVAREVEQLCREWKEAVVRPVRRNPFAAGRQGQEVSAVPLEPCEVGEPARAAASAQERPPTHVGAVPEPKALLAVLKALRLEMTLVAPGGERWAVINRTDYREGDTVAGMEIVEIREGEVKLQRGGVTCLLRMN